MGFFNKNKKSDILDLTERYKKQQEKLSHMKQEIQESKSEPYSQNSSNATPFGAISFFNNPSTKTKSYDNSSEETVDISEVQDKRKKLARRLMDMTEKIEELSNQIYHLQQRIEVLEKKSNVNMFG